MDVVPEQEVVSDRDHVPRHAVVRGRDPLGSEQFGLDRAEDLFAGLVQSAQPLTKILPLLAEAVADDLVRLAFQLIRRSGRFGADFGGRHN